MLSAASFLSGLTFLATTNTIAAGWPFAVVARFVVTAALLTIPIMVVEIVRIRHDREASAPREPADGSELVAADGSSDASGGSRKMLGDAS